MVPNFLNRFCSRSTLYFGALATLREPDLKLVYCWHPVLAYSASIDFDCTNLVFLGNIDWVTSDDEVVFKYELYDAIAQLPINADCHGYIKRKTFLYNDSPSAHIEQGSYF